MLNFFTHRIGIILKLVIFISTILLAIGYSVSYLYSSYNEAMQSTYGITIDFEQLISQVSFRPIWVAIVFIVIMIIVLILDLIFFVNRINDSIKTSLEEFKLQDHFPHFYSNMTFNQAIKNISELMALYKTLDVLKTARVNIENSTVKPLLNNVSEGIIFVNKHKVVSHINHVAESMLGLIPGEALGEVISRKINHELLLNLLDKTLEYDQKTVDMSLEDKKLTVGVFPIKDKFGDLVRIVVILKRFEDQLPEKKAKKKTSAK